MAVARKKPSGGTLAACTQQGGGSASQPADNGGGSASQPADNRKQLVETSSKRGDEIMALLRDRGCMPKETRSATEDERKLAITIRLMKKRNEFSHAQMQEMCTLSSRSVEQARVDHASCIMEEIRALGFVPTNNSRHPEQAALAKKYARAVKAEMIQ